jgi:sugar/nucleoside kinase (ribokinase family)
MATVDYLYLLPTYPAEDTENAALEHHIVVGGPAGRGAIAAARLGGDVRLLATCGVGGHADVLSQHLSREGIAATWVSSDTPSQHSAVILAKDNATRSTIWLGQPRADERTLALVPEFVREADVVLLDCTDEALTRAVVAAARAFGVPSVIDTGSFKAFSVDVVPDVDHVIAPKKWFSAQSPDFTPIDLASWPTRGIRVLAATAGDRGGYYLEAGSPSPSSWMAAGVDAIDTCGAGDTFHGAYTWAVGAGMSTADCFTVAAWSAGLKATAVGNTAIPTWPDLQRAAGGIV